MFRFISGLITCIFCIVFAVIIPFGHGEIKVDTTITLILLEIALIGGAFHAANSALNGEKKE